MAPPILVLNGPNLNMLGTREPEIYGAATLADVEARCRDVGKEIGFAIDFRQSNSEAELVGWIQEAVGAVAGIVINPAAFTHTSVAILDALKLHQVPIIELHISNPHKREPFRHHSFVTYAATATICGLGVNGYPVAVRAMADLVAAGAKGA